MSVDENYKLDPGNNQEHELYVRAIKALDANGTMSEYHAVPENGLQEQFRKDTDRYVTARRITFRYTDGQYEKIFGNGRQLEEDITVNTNRLAGGNSI